MENTYSIDEFDVPRAGLIANVRKPSKVGVVLGVTSLLLLVSTITFIILYVSQDKHKTCSSPACSCPLSSSPTCWCPACPSPTCSSAACSSAACIVSSSDIIQNLNTSVEPCDDFYQFSCGGFVKNRDIRDEQLTLEAFTIVQNVIDHKLKYLLEDEELMLKFSKDPNSAVHKALSFYKSCVNKHEIETAGVKPFLDVIEKYMYLNITNQMEIVNNDSWILERVLARAFLNLGTSAFIDVDVGRSLVDSSKIVIYVSAGSSGWDRGVEDKKISLSREKLVKIHKGYKKFMSTVFQLLGASPGKSLEQVVSAIFELEYSLNKLKRSWSEEAAKVGYKNTIQFMTLDELNTFTSYKFNWMAYFEEIIRDTDITYISPYQKLLVVLPDDIKKIIDVIHQQPKSLLADAIMWNVVRGFITTLPKSFRDAANEFREVEIGIETREPRWRICGAVTNSLFNYATALLFANKYLSEDARKRAADVFIEIKGQFIDGLEEQTWMDTETREAARRKLYKMKDTIGYPSFIKRPDVLNELYKNIHVTPTDVFQNLLNISKAGVLYKLHLIGRSADETRLPLSLIGVNAFYSPQRNSMTVLMGILQDPFYDSDRLKALNYGAIGMVIGHEITHGFDVSGSQFDENGNLRTWWTKTSSRNFKKRSLCLAKEYNNTVVFGRKVDGVKTLSENIADNGGLKYAYRAYRKWRDRNGEEDKLPGLGYNNDQLFFISFAQTWCTKYREEAIDLLMRVDTHSLNPVRVRVPLSNFPEFSKAFGCKPPNTTCTVW